MIQISHISKTFGRLRALDDVSLDLRPGQSVAFIGPNGSGKTTFLKSILGLVVPDRGAWLHGREQGLDRFCVPYRAYQLGEYGGGFDVAICRNYDQDRLVNAYEQGLEVNRLSHSLAAIDGEMSDILARLEDEDVEKKERIALAFRLGELAYQRNDVQRAYEDARSRARNL